MQYMIFLIPIVAILVGGFTEWLKFKEKQLKLGNTTNSLAGNVDDIQKSLDEAKTDNKLLQDRIRNLEAIVTTQMWDDVVDQSSRQNSVKTPLLELPDELPDVTDEEKARQLAKRIQR